MIFWRGSSSSRKRPAICSGLSGLEPLESRTLLSGVTLITHGYQIDTQTLPNWVDVMAQAIASEASPDTAIYEVDVTANDSTIQKLSGKSPSDPNNHEADVFVLLNWTSIASNPAVNSTAIADHIAPLFSNVYSSLGIVRPLGELPIHLIGHSRGGSVISELAKDLASKGFWVDQLTTLDPHPVQSPFLIDVPDPDVVVPNNVIFADNYFQTDNLDITEAFVTGSSVVGAHNINLNGLAIGHSGVHRFYQGTIDLTATSDGDGSISNSWYDAVGPRDSVGFAWSDILGGTRPTDGWAFGDGAPRVTAAVQSTGFSRWDNIVLGNYAGSITQGQTVPVDLGFQDFNHDATITIGFDNDTNPYNGRSNVTSLKTAWASATALTESTLDSAFEYESTVPTLGLAPGDYHLFAMISNGVHTRYDYAQGVVTVAAAPVPVISVDDVTVTEGTPAVFTIHLSNPSPNPVTVSYAALDGAASASGKDYRLKQGKVTFNPGETTKTVIASVPNDAFYEDDETFSLQLGNAVGATISDDTAQATILDNDPAPVISVTSVSGKERDAGTKSMLFKVTLSAAVNRAVTVQFDTAEGSATANSDYVPISQTVTFLPGRSRTQKIAVPILGDTSTEGNEDFTVSLGSPVNAELGQSEATGTIIDDEFAPYDIAGLTFMARITRGSTPYASHGSFSVTAADVGNTYELSGDGADVLDSFGDYTYTRTDKNSAIVNLIDSITGASLMALTFTSASKTKYKLTRIGGGGGSQNGVIAVEQLADLDLAIAL
ncbi:MAG: hypothetical protein K8S99_06630 [Planctomycetes bacterium]|nr:hypothetical protein [Planctomycetota bacterium]